MSYEEMSDDNANRLHQITGELITLLNRTFMDLVIGNRSVLFPDVPKQILLIAMGQLFSASAGQVISHAYNNPEVPKEEREVCLNVAMDNLMKLFLDSVRLTNTRPASTPTSTARH